MTFTTLSDGSNTFANKRWTEYTGLSVEQTSGAGWKRAIHPEDLVRHSEKWAISIATGQPFEDEARFRGADNEEYRWFLVRGVPLRDQNGKVIRWYGTLTDIEDRKRADEALQLVSSDLQDSKAKLEEGQRIAHVGYWDWDLTSDRVIWSDETYRIYGLKPQEHPIDTAVLRKMIHPEDLEFVFRVAEESVREGLRTDVEHRIIRPNGEVRTVHSLGDLKKDASGRPYQMFGTVQDITDRKCAEEKIRQSEEELRQLVDVISQQVFVFDAEWNPLFANERELEYTGLTSQEIQSKDVVARIFHPEDLKKLEVAREQARSSGAAFEMEARIRGKDGVYRWFLIRDNSLRDEQGRVLRWYGTRTDIEDRKRAEEALQRSQFYIGEGQRVAHMGSWAFNAEGFEYWSSELFRIFGLDPTGTPPTVEEYLDLVHPEDREFME